MTFRISRESDVVLCVGDPDCQAAHIYLLEQLLNAAGQQIPAPLPLNASTVGNLGEFIAFTVCRDAKFAGFTPFPANAFSPLAAISRSEIDLIWLRFATEPDEDLALIQEVKTTTDPSLGYASRLIDDYEKLFGTDPRLTLHSRLQAIKNELEFKLKRKELCARVDRLAGISPYSSPRLRLIPTAVHEQAGSLPVKKLLAIRSSLIADGWQARAVEPWSISLTDLEDRLDRLSQGER